VDEITDALGAFSKTNQSTLFRTLIIDQCHTIRNLITYGTFVHFVSEFLDLSSIFFSLYPCAFCLLGGIGAALLGIAAGRTVPMTCTPFINSTSDLATLMLYIDPTMAAAHKKWWKEATKQESSESIVEAISSWKKY
jgi:hypothetical protein